MDNVFLTNTTSQTFLERIQENLKTCKSFCFSVSFIKFHGLSLIINDIDKAIERGADGKIITSTYQKFTDIGSLNHFKKLAAADNFECHVDDNSFIIEKSNRARGYHSKGYLFEFDDHYETIVGSTNITRLALLSNIEWDLVVGENKDSHPTYDRVLQEFNDMWAETHPLTDDLIDTYSSILNMTVGEWDIDVDGEFRSIVQPNFMQKKALKELNRFRQLGVIKALVVAAAGSGKTYLSAFDAYVYNPKRLLYVVHTGTILERSIETFKSVFDSNGVGVSDSNSVDSNKKYGRFYGGYKDLDAEFLFTTNDSMSSNLKFFTKDQFDYIIIDECHHAPASTYQKIIDYFKPGFLLGLTATPERMDLADVAGIFDNNVACEIRLRDSIINGMVLPFKYYGVKDNHVDYGLDPKDILKLDLASEDDKHCEFVHDEIEKHRLVLKNSVNGLNDVDGDGNVDNAGNEEKKFDNDVMANIDADAYNDQNGVTEVRPKLKALAFCRSVQHAITMSKKFEKWYKTKYLTGRDSVNDRIEAFKQLQSNDEGTIEILFAVDVLNEGVDLPGVNMVIFLRPTDSSTIFIQQLGRGLRKSDGVPYCTVLDLIGNHYRRSVQIAMALCSVGRDVVIDKPTLKDFVNNGFISPELQKCGVEINIDEISRKEILDSIDSMNFNKTEILKQDYLNFKRYLGAPLYPKHIDYLNNEAAPDLIRFMDVSTYTAAGKKSSSKNHSYYNFLRSIGEENIPSFTEEQVGFINRLSDYLPLVWSYEYLIVQGILSGIEDDVVLREYVKNNNQNYNPVEMPHAISMLKKRRIIVQNGHNIKLSIPVEGQFRDYVDDLLTYGLNRYSSEYGDEKGFKLYMTYKKEQVLLKTLKDLDNKTPGTYYTHNQDGGFNVYIFALLRKNEKIEERLKYKDVFLNQGVFQWETMTRLGVEDYKKITDANSKAYLFIRKVESEYGVTMPFTYVGTGTFSEPKAPKSATGTYLFDVSLDTVLPVVLWEDYRVPDSN